LIESKQSQSTELPGTADWPASAEWNDPRKGDLFWVIEQAEKKMNGSED
jgi:hypothetical protein